MLTAIQSLLDGLHRGSLMSNYLIKTLVGVVVTAVVGTLGYLAINAQLVNRTLGKVESQIVDTSNRLDRIANALPDFRVRIAQEELAKPVRTLVLVARAAPSVDPDQKAQSIYTIIDLPRGSGTVGTVNLTEAETEQLFGATAYKGMQLDSNFASLAELQSAAFDAGDRRLISSAFNLSESFVLRGISSEQFIAETSWLGGDEEAIDVGVEGYNYYSVVEAMERVERQLREEGKIQ